VGTFKNFFELFFVPTLLLLLSQTKSSSDLAERTSKLDEFCELWI
jgi:hypothetical protein